MICAKCHRDNPAGTKFCGECGARLVISCAGCGTSNPPGNRFCGECGMPLGGREPLRATPPPRHLAERILQSREASQGREVEARAALAPVHDTFTEGHGMRDLAQARAVLERLAVI